MAVSKSSASGSAAGARSLAGRVFLLLATTALAVLSRCPCLGVIPRIDQRSGQIVYAFAQTARQRGIRRMQFDVNVARSLGKTQPHIRRAIGCKFERHRPQRLRPRRTGRLGGRFVILRRLTGWPIHPACGRRQDRRRLRLHRGGNRIRLRLYLRLKRRRLRRESDWKRFCPEPESPACGCSCGVACACVTGTESSFGCSVARILTSSAGAAVSTGLEEDSCGGASTGCGDGAFDGGVRVATGGSGSGNTGVAIAIAGGTGISLLFAGAAVFRMGWLSTGAAASVLSCLGGGSGVFISPVLETSALFRVETSRFVPSTASPRLTSGTSPAGTN